jgi:AbrB family looped-hinge helix DNA binding protein
MNSTITVKFQTTIPKAVRERLGIRVNDAIEWRVLKGKAEVVPVRTGFLRHRNVIHSGKATCAPTLKLRAARLASLNAVLDATR